MLTPLDQFVRSTLVGKRRSATRRLHCPSFPIVVAAALARALARLLEDPGTVERMGQAARRRARELFGFERQVDAYDGLYQRLAEEATHAGNI